ncbi:hypothetical protein DV515_00015684 [Chloebia gouldiae]|uniref:Uncharacterized protein n=1 Tax=Chloebia gouldiae TaxID=44316 RepID=A0A3L8RUQ0_CHLGU|nr:hypothetical protein DV515_00015684 [Chloebia gouldiae]
MGRSRSRRTAPSRHWPARDAATQDFQQLSEPAKQTGEKSSRVIGEVPRCFLLHPLLSTEQDLPPSPSLQQDCLH